MASSDVLSIFPTLVWKFELASQTRTVVNARLREALGRLRPAPGGAPHRMRSHPNNFLSRVYYVQTQPDADTINFHDPRIQSSIIRPPVTELTAGQRGRIRVLQRTRTRP
jgi:hypothetical protein